MDKMTLAIEKNEVFRYLGYKGGNVDHEIHLLTEHCIRRTHVLIEPVYLYKRFMIEPDKVNGAIAVCGTGMLLGGNDIASLLSGCNEIIMLCTTLGAAFDKQIRVKISEEPTKGVIYDSCGSAAIEALTDYAESEIKKVYAEEAISFTHRFSPGYGDLPLALNRDILEALDSYRKIGLTVTPGYIMTPRKSVTAIIGIKKKEE